MPDANRSRLAAFMEERRAELGRTWQEVANVGGLPRETINQVRFGQSTIRTLTKRRIDLGLDWEPGSVDAVLLGGDPIPLQARTANPMDALVQEIYRNQRVPEERKQELVRLIRQAEAQLLTERALVVDELRRWEDSA